MVIHLLLFHTPFFHNNNNNNYYYHYNYNYNYYYNQDVGRNHNNYD